MFKEAKRRERLRRTVAVAGLIALVGGGLGLAFGLRGPGGGKLLPLAAPRFSSAAIAATTGARTAKLSFVYGNSTEEGCAPHTNAPVTRGSGVISFAASSLSYSKTLSGCQNLNSPVQTQWRAVGNSVYETFPLPLAGAPTSSAKPWLAVSRHTYSTKLVGGRLNDSMISTTPFQILKALTGSLRRLVDTSIGGVATTEYVGSATLASFDANGFPGLTAAQVSANDNGTQSAFVPQANTIPITVHVWIDAQGRVVQLEASEPLYTGVYTDGSDEEGATQIASTTTQGGGPRITLPNGRKIPPNPITHLRLRHLRRQSTEVVTVDFSDFGSAIAVAAPPMSKVTTYKPRRF